VPFVFASNMLQGLVVLCVYDTVCLVDRDSGLIECGSGQGPELPGLGWPPGRLRNLCARAGGPKTRTSNNRSLASLATTPTRRIREPPCTPVNQTDLYRGITSHMPRS